MHPRTPITILIADDDPEDRMLAQDALDESRLGNRLQFVEDGRQLLDYLERRGVYQDPASSPTPGIILIDLNMPVMDGREAIAAIKANPRLRHIPLVVLTTSQAEEDIVQTYGLGINSYIAKPVSFQSLVAIMQTFGRYWFEIVELPGR